MKFRWIIPFVFILAAAAPGAADPFGGADANGDGKVDKREFSAAAREKFREYDRNGDGFLDREEMMAACRSFENESCMREFSGIDKNRDGRISRKEFLGGAGARFREYDRSGDGILDRPEVDFRSHYRDPASVSKLFGGFYF
ncbi:MAG TPA: EF-hand domain-containing protein [Syntrophales bacterium]|nr:EF-hand domain-containing protein [Syntrophales bacterium]